MRRAKTPFLWHSDPRLTEFRKSHDPDGVHFTADFIVTSKDEILFLEGGPPHELGAHPCCFQPGEIQGVALENRNLENRNLENRNLENRNLENRNLENRNLENRNLENRNLEKAESREPPQPGRRSRGLRTVHLLPEGTTPEGTTPITERAPEWPGTSKRETAQPSTPARWSARAGRDPSWKN